MPSRHVAVAAARADRRPRARRFVANLGNKLGAVLYVAAQLLGSHLLCHLVPAVTCPNVSWALVDSRS
jgi:membrane-associated PAP2 superfamily phosphatase